MSRLYDFFSRLGLQHKFILLTTCAIILVMSIVGYFAVEWEEKIFYGEVETQGRLLGQTLAIPIINDLVYEKLGLVAGVGLLNDYTTEIFNRQDADLLYIAILDNEGRVVSHNDVTEQGKLYADPLTQKALTTDNMVVQQVSGGEHNALDFSVPLSIGKKRWGTLRFAISLEKAEHEIHATINRVILLTIVLLLGGFAIILFLSRRFISPIIRLATTMEKARSDDLDLKVEVKGHDELAVLGERFNSMIERIRQANDEVRKTQEKLVLSEKLASMGILAAGVAHEINNPLGGIINCLQMLRQNGGINGSNPELREKYLGLVNEGLDKIENTVSRLLWMSRKDEHIPADVNVKNAVDNVYAFLEYEIKKGGIVFKNDTPDNLRVFTDVHDFEQVLLNLFINSMHATKNGGVLEVRGWRHNSTVEIEVNDNGCGIKAEHISKVFDPFFTTKPTGKGTGLGLWLAYEVLKSYHGDISVESEVGKWSRFTISLPAYQLR
jgi:signal transduction histidine kinase